MKMQSKHGRLEQSVERRSYPEVPRGVVSLLERHLRGAGQGGGWGHGDAGAGGGRGGNGGLAGRGRHITDGEDARVAPNPQGCVRDYFVPFVLGERP